VTLRNKPHSVTAEQFRYTSAQEVGPSKLDGVGPPNLDKLTSSPNSPVLDHQFDLDDVIDVPAAPAALLAALRSVPDPRQRQGLRHELDGILTRWWPALSWPAADHSSRSPSGPRRPRPTNWAGWEYPEKPRPNRPSGAPCNASTPMGSTSSWVPGPRSTTSSTRNTCRSSPLPPKVCPALPITVVGDACAGKQQGTDQPSPSGPARRSDAAAGR